jgi:hypothetical protein
MQLTMLKMAGITMAALAGPAAIAQAQAERYTAPITLTTGTVTLRATATYSDGSSADRLYRVTRDEDSDGDGVPDETWLRVACSGGAVTGAWEYKGPSPRDVATGQASGKRQHGAITIRKEWDRSAIIGQRVSWDLKEAKGALVAARGAKTMGADDWHKRTVRDGAANLCV